MKLEIDIRLDNKKAHISLDDKIILPSQIIELVTALIRELKS